MKVAHVVCTFPPYKGGMGNSVFNLAKVLSEINYDVTVFTPVYGKIIKGINNERFKIERLKPLIRFGNAALLPQLIWKLSRALGIDIIHLHYPFYGTAFIVFLRKLLWRNKIKLIIHYHMEPTAKGIKGLVFELNQLLFEPILMRTADMITCASLDYVKHSGLADYYSKHKDKFREISFGVDLKKFSVEHKESREKIILFIGGLDKAHYFKGVDVLLKAISKLKVVGCKLKVVGDGDMRSEYEKMAEELGIADKVNFLGGVENEKLTEYYQNCDVFVLPSINKGEAFGMVLLEAMACGKPVIASNLPGVRSVFKDGKQGLLVKPGDVNDLLEKIKVILNNDNLAGEMGKAGRRLVEEKYTWEKVGERLNKTYREI